MGRIFPGRDNCLTDSMYLLAAKRSYHSPLLLLLYCQSLESQTWLSGKIFVESVLESE